MIRRFLYIWGLSLSIFCVAQAAHAGATLSLTPASGNYGAGGNFSVKVMVDGGGQPMNAVEANLSFPSALLSVTRVSKDGSAFSLWTTEPTYSNAQGTISFGGGSPTPFSAKSMLVEIFFRAVKEGSASVSFTSGSVLAADGQGTDILTSKQGGTYAITPKASSPPPPPPPPQSTSTPPPTPVSIGASTPGAPVISSLLFKDENAWYKERSGKLNWVVPGGVTAVRLTLDRNAKTSPKVVYAPAIAEREFTDLDEGVWYFAAQFQNENGWGAIGRRKIMIDATPPSVFTLKLEKEESPTNATPTVLFDATDELSGILTFDIVVDGSAPFQVPATDLKNKAYTFASMPDGSHHIVVKALDAAGNSREAVLDIVTAGAPVVVEKPKKAIEEIEQAPTRFGTWGGFVVILLLLALIGMFGLSGHQKRRLMRERDKLKKESQGMLDEVSKIFAALREEVEEQVGAIDKKPRLSEMEKQVVAKIKDALDIAEEFIDKEIEGIQKFLK